MLWLAFFFLVIVMTGVSFILAGQDDNMTSTNDTSACDCCVFHGANIKWCLFERLWSQYPSYSLDTTFIFFTFLKEEYIFVIHNLLAWLLILTWLVYHAQHLPISQKRFGYFTSAFEVYFLFVLVKGGKIATWNISKPTNRLTG